MGKRCVVFLLAVVTVLALWPGGARASPGVTPRAKRPAKLYQKGAQAYAQGDLNGALAAYEELQRADPGDRTAALSIGRIKMELAARQATPARAVPAAAAHRQADDLDDIILQDLAVWFNFERTLGDVRSDLGTLQARNGKVAQLMAERRLAISRDRGFPKERELRALIRRLPVS